MPLSYFLASTTLQCEHALRAERIARSMCRFSRKSTPGGTGLSLQVSCSPSPAAPRSSANYSIYRSTYIEALLHPSKCSPEVPLVRIDVFFLVGRRTPFPIPLFRTPRALTLFLFSFLLAYAPGRVNVIGEHTDYNAGFQNPPSHFALAGYSSASDNPAPCLLWF